MDKEIGNGGLFKKYSAHTRFLLFYCICIWIRLFIAYMVYKLAKKKIVILCILIVILFSVCRNFYTNGSVWWCRSCHGYISIVLAVITLLSLLDYIDSKYISYILVFDIIFGVLYTLIKKPFTVEYV